MGGHLLRIPSSIPAAMTWSHVGAGWWHSHPLSFFEDLWPIGRGRRSEPAVEGVRSPAEIKREERIRRQALPQQGGSVRIGWRKSG
jgi:hypothetical protein